MKQLALKPKIPKEADIQRAIIDRLAFRPNTWVVRQPSKHNPEPLIRILPELEKIKGPGVVVWRQNTGVAKMTGRGGRQIPYRFSINGTPDIAGLIHPWGVGLGIEVKRPLKSSKLSEDQAAYNRMMLAMGGAYFVARSPEEALVGLDRWIELLSARFAVYEK